jgi:hypothetical protein
MRLKSDTKVLLFIVGTLVILIAVLSFVVYVTLQ